MNEEQTPSYLVGIGDLEASFGFVANQHVIEDKLVLLLSIDSTALGGVLLLPDGQVLADAMLFKDGADIVGVNGWNASLSQKLVRDALRAVIRVSPSDVYADFLY